MVKYIKAFDPTQRTYFKRNYGDALTKIVPGVYSLKDFALSGVGDDPLDLLLKTHLTAAANISEVLNVSATTNFPQIDTLSGITPFFVKQNNLTQITPFLFERDLLEPLNFELEAFDTSTDWKNYLQNDLLPAIQLNNFASVINTPYGEVETSAAFGFSGSALHEYYINTLGWFYFLNTSAPVGGNYAPSSYVLDKFNELFLGKELYTLDGIKGFEEYLWKNYPEVSVFQTNELVPPDYLSGTSEFTSGTQNLDRLNTLVDILYSNKYADDGDFKVQEEFDAYLLTSSFIPQEVNKGPFSKLLRVLGYFYQDINSPVDQLNSLYDIDRVPDDYLPYLSDLIGWDLIGSDPDRWRSQIRNAVRIYKAKGTVFSTQLTLDTLFGEDNGFALSSTMYELYESYVPFLIYYLLAIGSPFFNKAGYKDNPFLNWTSVQAGDAGVKDINGIVDYSDTSMDSNIRRCVDHILKQLWINHNSNFLLGDKLYPEPGDPDFVFTYRGRDYPIPPFEEVRYYEKVQISNPLLNTLKGELINFNVNEDYITSALSYIKGFSISAVDDISIGNKFVLFTSAFQPALDASTVWDDISNKSADYLPLWSAKSSHFDLHLQRDDFVFTNRRETSNTTLGVLNSLKALNKTIPAHAIPRVKLFLSAIDDVSNFMYACPRPMFVPEDVFTSSTVVNAWESSGVNMNGFYTTLGIGHGLSSTANSRKFVDSITDILIDGDGGDITSGAVVPRNSLRRRNLKLTIPRDGVFDRTGFDMPNSYTPSTFDQCLGASGGGALNLGYNYSAFAFQTPFTLGTDEVNSLHPVWFNCETSTSPNQFFGIDTSNTFHWRGADVAEDILNAGKCLSFVRREELPEIMRVMHRTLEKDAYRAAYERFKEVSGSWAASSYYMDPIQSIANRDFNGVSSWDQYADYTFGSGVHQVYNYYAKEFGRHGTAPHLVSGELGPGGRNIFSHIYGPLLYNGKFEKDGSAVSMVASAFDIADYSGVTSAVLIADSPKVTGGTNQLIVGNGYEFRYPFAFSGVEFCYKTGHLAVTTPPKSAFQCYRTDVNYGIQNPQIDTSLIDNGLLQVSAQGNNVYGPRIRFSLNDYGSTTTSANLLLPEHNFSFSMNLAKYKGDPMRKVWVWIHTMPEDGYFWSWVPRKDWNYSNNHRNGEWISTSAGDFDGGQNGPPHTWDSMLKIRNELGHEFLINNTTGVTSIDQLKSSDFNNYSIDFNTSNKQYRDSGKFLPHPKGYTPRFVHRSDQKYVVEVVMQTMGGFGESNNFVFKNISIIDKTLANTALDEYTVSYTDDHGKEHEKTITRTGIDEYRIIFKYLNSLAASSLGDGYSTRIAADSSGIFEASGGSRLNYRYHPKWGVYTDHVAAPPAGAWTTEPNNYTLIDFKEGS
jgi:hypothetical protein